MKKTFAMLLLAAGSMFAADFSVGIQIGAPPAPRVMRVRPRAPGPDYVWVDGYWYPQGRRYVWHNGYWSRPPFAGALWVGPHYEGGRYFEGFWQHDERRFEHDHRWDRDRKNRDWDRDRH